MRLRRELEPRAKALVVLLIYGGLFWFLIYCVLRIAWSPDLPGMTGHVQ